MVFQSENKISIIKIKDESHTNKPSLMTTMELLHQFVWINLPLSSDWNTAHRRKAAHSDVNKHHFFKTNNQQISAWVYLIQEMGEREFQLQNSDGMYHSPAKVPRVNYLSHQMELGCGLNTQS